MTVITISFPVTETGKITPERAEEYASQAAAQARAQLAALVDPNAGAMPNS